MSELPHPGNIIDHLRSLHTDVAAATAREDGLSRALAARQAGIKRQLAGQLDDIATTGRQGMARQDEHYRQSLEEINRAMAARARWIHRAYHNAKANLADSLQAAKDQRNARIQTDNIRERKNREDMLLRATTRHEEFLHTLAEEQSRRRRLRAATLDSLRSFKLWLNDFFLTPAVESESPSGAAADLHAQSLAQLAGAEHASEAAARRILPSVFRILPFWVLAGVLAFIHLGVFLFWPGMGMATLWPGLAISLGVLAMLWILGLLSSIGIARRTGRALGASHRLGHAAAQASAANLKSLGERLSREEKQQGETMRAALKDSDTAFKHAIGTGLQKLDKQVARLPDQLESLHRQKRDRGTAAHAAARARIESGHGQSRPDLEQAAAEAIALARAEATAKQDDLAKDWQAGVVTAVNNLRAMQAASLAAFPPWDTAHCAAWLPPHATPEVVRIGSIEVDIATLCDAVPRDPMLAMPGPQAFGVPLNLVFPSHASLMIESADDRPAAALSAIALRLLAAHPPGRVSFAFIDPVGLGREFAGLMHLADYEELLITGRIWTQAQQIEDRLLELTEHIEKIIQMYLRNEFADISEYNRHAGSTAEKHRYLVIAGFPAAFSETAVKRLMAIASSGARCGVHLLIHRDTRVPMPDPALNAALAAACTRLQARGDKLVLAGAPAGANRVVLDPAPSREDATVLIHRIGRASVDSNRVELPFAYCAPAPDAVWTGDATTEIRVPIGRAGAKKLQRLALGKGTRQHMLVAGKTGSGKSTLFHVVITNLALHFSPAELEFYLIDFKKGVEFKCYATKNLPHARVVAIESDREFALSVLRNIDAKLKDRGELFRLAGVQDLAGYRAHAAAKPMPRTLLIIDEFQEFFTEDDAIAQETSLLLDRIVRQGRAFGIHVILGSQTLGGAYTLARATMGQMVVRVALQCNESDAHLIMDDDNPAPRLLTRPGEGIYNDQAGIFAANSPFQIAWLSEADRDVALDAIHARARRDGMDMLPRVVFEGNAPADVADNRDLRALLQSRPRTRPVISRAWLGAANAIKGPTEAAFRRQSGSHLLVTGQSADRSLDLLLVAARGLAAQYPPDGVSIFILDPAATADPQSSRFAVMNTLLPGCLTIGGIHDAPAILAGLATVLADRADGDLDDAPDIFLIIHELQRFKCLRPDDDFSFSMDETTAPKPSRIFADILSEGGPLGIHILAATDTWNNVSRWIPRKLLAEFGMRVLFQMSANDSANLIDSPAATTLGTHRALFFDDHHGSLETFRPYALPGGHWFTPPAHVPEPIPAMP